ncbi:MAG TPA: class I SAM-dependent DNA methyltransferase [Chloroflexota bacterium]|nr:class I SAM-dependent DNA methyltransferase [Chloroflexota bacterium]HUM68877.1 class I SAM-dependent DNA methyltransferase [Chloroflexota bacterium]
MATRVIDIETNLWNAADQLRANSNLSAQEYSVPVLGLIFLRFADYKFSRAAEMLPGNISARRTTDPKLAYQAMGVLYVPEEARFHKLVALSEGEDIGRAINEAMKAIERENPVLKDVLPKSYNRLTNSTLATLLKYLNFPQMEIDEDLFGRIYEYFLGQFAMGEGRRGGEFFTPSSIVRLIVEIIEPYQGRILDPACGSGGMFVQSERFRQHHQQQVSGTSEVPGTLAEASPTLSIYGQEKTSQTVRLCQMNLAVHGLEGDIKQTNSYYEDPHRLVGKFDYVMANPPFNVNGVNTEDLKGSPRFPLGMPKVDNANYLWIQLFYAALNETGRAGFVMANSASDARHSEQEIRRKLIAEEKAVDIMVAIGSNFFYTVTLPCTLWFLDKGKRQMPGTSVSQVPGTSEVPGTYRANTVLFIDARKFYRQVSRAVRDFSDEQLQFLVDIARLYRGEAVNMGDRPIPVAGGWGGAKLMRDLFPDGVYADVPGLCKVATHAEIEAQGWSLNPGRYVGVAGRAADDFNFFERLEELNEELELLNAEANELETTIALNMQQILEGQF